MRTGALVLCALVLSFTTGCVAAMVGPAVMVMSSTEENNTNTETNQHISGIATQTANLPSGDIQANGLNATIEAASITDDPEIHLSGNEIPAHLSGNTFGIQKISHQW